MHIAKKKQEVLISGNMKVFVIIYVQKELSQPISLIHNTVFLIVVVDYNNRPPAGL